MQSLDLGQITEKLNTYFSDSSRRIVFWYDDNGDFAEDVDAIELSGAKLLKLEPNAMFQTKYILERQDTETNYLVYAPFPKPDVHNHALEDIYLYSKHFHADWISMLCNELGIPSLHRKVMEKNSKFFKAKEREKRFAGYGITDYSESVIKIAMMCALCKSASADFDELVRTLLSTGELEGNPLLNELENYDLLPAFWECCKEAYGYNDSRPSLKRFAMTLFVSYTASQLAANMLPPSWKEFVSNKQGSAVAFISSFMNNTNYQSDFKLLSEQIAAVLDIKTAFADVDSEHIVDCDAFSVFDELLIDWIVKRLLLEDTAATLRGLSLEKLCEHRKRRHFGMNYCDHYDMLLSSCTLVRAAYFTCKSDFADIQKQYLESDFRIDEAYRMFFLYYDRLDDSSNYEKLRQLVENIYTNEYLGKLLPAWNSQVDIKSLMQDESSQLNFYNRYVAKMKSKTAVIISDGLRYEVGHALNEKFQTAPNYNATLTAMYSTIPAYTQLGMASLLPHKSLTLKEDGDVLIDELPSDGVEKREKVLQTIQENARCVSFSELPKDSSGLREFFKGSSVTYIYHNKIDQRGSNAPEEIAVACKEAIDEIYRIVDRLRKNADVSNFFITSDHGFLYKREKFSESEKINLKEKKGNYYNRRFIIADEPVIGDGVGSVPLSDIIGGDTKKIVSYPIGANVFKTQGGLSFVHGGSSPQEMIIPLITIKTEKASVPTQPAKIALVSTIRKITNLITSVEVIQQEAVCDKIESAEYRLFFISDENDIISNEHIFHADKKDTDANMRISKLRFSFKNRKYDSKKKYYLVAKNSDGVELFRHEIIIDIAFADDFGFD